VTGVNQPEPAATQVDDRGLRNLLMRVLTAAVMIPVAIGVAYAGGWLWFALVAVVSIGLFVEWTMVVGRSAGWIVVGIVYAAAALVASVVVRLDPIWGFAALMFVLLIVWVTDIGGYFAGRGIGGPKLWPRVSPKKTWAGAIGGLVLSLAVAAGFAWFGLGRLLPLLVLATGLTIVSQLGDLFESAVKRRFGVKDSSHIIPGHGGLLDRLDGYVFAVVAAALIGFLRGGADGVGRGLMVW
jgi:phosphatidate cytidylyltransferase